MADLNRIFISVKGPDGEWKTKSLAECSFTQFLAWAMVRHRAVRERFPFEDYLNKMDADWLSRLKSDFVDFLRSHGQIVCELRM